MAKLEQRTLDGSDPEEAYSVWAGQGPNLQRMAERADGLVLFTHETGVAMSAWRLAIPASTSQAQLMHLLAALHDYCAQSGLVAPRAWSVPGEGKAASGNAASVPARGGTKQISIPLNDPEVGRKLQEALRPSSVKSGPAQKQPEVPE